MNGNISTSNKEHVDLTNSNNNAHNVQENLEEFDYSKISDEIDAIADYLEQLSEEVTKMQVESAVANIELVSMIENMDFESKLEEVKKMYEDYVKEKGTELQK
ncbi:uncharacterized protein [Parasteatoda tepidariorum]|uniref:uncharacterized protein n=1 Tax=Parasteatoda tepidariorum TaxID=114398 RepID=UPI001C726C9F|nr:uncharacterized protein LOC122270557 [Parasteatoda tepidariorum]